MKEKYLYTLLITDLYSRYSETCFIYNIRSDTIASHFEKQWICKYGPPQKCLTDNGRQFISESFKNINNKYKISHIKVAPHNPTGNSLVERQNKEIGIVLRISKGSSLKKLAKNIWIRLNLNINISINYPPYEIFYRKSIFQNHEKTVNIDDKKIRSRLLRQINKRNMNLKFKRKGIKYKKGDFIYLMNYSTEKVDLK
ncbi:Gag-Pro-Pol polyprotein [Dictyocoela muelleri]|nr:Gag-Pro-Pol polyprotein [Dictyocoela muelleri]